MSQRRDEDDSEESSDGLPPEDEPDARQLALLARSLFGVPCDSTVRVRGDAPIVPSAQGCVGCCLGDRFMAELDSFVVENASCMPDWS